MEVVQSFWFGKKLSTIEYTCIASYLKHDHIFHLYMYDYEGDLSREIYKNVREFYNSKNFKIKNAQEILDYSFLFYDYSHQVGIAAFSDLFRYKLLLKNGGWWVDLDTICIKPLDFKANYVFSTQRYPNFVCIEDELQYGGGGRITTCMIKAPKNSAFLKKIYNQAFEQISKKKTYIAHWFSPHTLGGVLLNKMQLILFKIFIFRVSASFFSLKLTPVVPWGIIGPEFLEEKVSCENNSAFFIAPPTFFCEIDFFNAKKFILKDQKIDETRIFVFHVWNAMWSGLGLEKDLKYPNSLIDRLRQEYLPKKIFETLPSWNERQDKIGQRKMCEDSNALKMVKKIKYVIFSKNQKREDR